MNYLAPKDRAKMTMHISESLLRSVMERYGIETKTEAVHFALREVERLHRLQEMGAEGLGLTPEELGSAYAPDYDPDVPGSEFGPQFTVLDRVAEEPVDYKA